MHIKLVGILILNLLISNIFASTIFEAKNGDTITVSISENDLTRIEISGQKIIKNFSSADVTKKITKPLGQIFLVPNTKKTFNLYIVSEKGNTYNLKLTPSKNISGDSIIIRPIGEEKKILKTNLKLNSIAYIRNINLLIKAMYLDMDSALYSVSEVNQPITTYDGLLSVLLKTYTSSSLNGQILLLKNVTKAPMLLTEAQFYSDNTLAVSIENPELPSNEFTRVFIIKASEL